MSEQIEYFAQFIGTLRRICSHQRQAREGDQTSAQIQALVRANDPLYELLMRLGMSKYEDDFWCATLQQLAAYFGATGQPTRQSVLVDTQVRWREAKNIWHNAALRTALYRLASPLRWLIRQFRGR